MKTLLVLAFAARLAGCATIPYCRENPDHERRCAAVTSSSAISKNNPSPGLLAFARSRTAPS